MFLSDSSKLHFFVIKCLIFFKLLYFNKGNGMKKVGSLPGVLAHTLSPSTWESEAEDLSPVSSTLARAT